MINHEYDRETYHFKFKQLIIKSFVKIEYMTEKAFK